MSLPPGFSTSEDYFNECFKFFVEYEYLYSVSNVEILTHKVLDKIDVNIENFDIFGEEIDIASINDEYLEKFFGSIKKFQAVHSNYAQDELKYNINVPLSVKKKHEITYLAKLITDVCGNIDCDVVVDFGSGLGYLDQLIFQLKNYKVLGIEGNENHYVGAKKRQRKYHENSMDSVKYIRHTIDGDSHERLNKFLIEKYDYLKDYCITGLHACADLTIDAINIFLKLNEAKAIAIMPCCYHKMTGCNGQFKNFPLSNNLKGIFATSNGQTKMKIPFLRLGAQPPRVDEKLSDLVFNLLARAVLQLYAWRHNCTLKRNKRKPVKTRSMDSNFDQYIQDAVSNGFTLTKNEPLQSEEKSENTTFDVEEVKTLWSEITSTTYRKASIYILLQNALQPVIENFILYDRLVYLKESGVKNCEFKRILNQNISPRCLALIAYKSEDDNVI